MNRPGCTRLSKWFGVQFAFQAKQDVALDAQTGASFKVSPWILQHHAVLATAGLRRERHGIAMYFAATIDLIDLIDRGYRYSCPASWWYFYGFC